MPAEDVPTPIPSGPYRCPSCGSESLRIGSAVLDALSSDVKMSRAYFEYSCPCGFADHRETVMATEDVITSAAVAVLRGEAGEPL